MPAADDLSIDARACCNEIVTKIVRHHDRAGRGEGSRFRTTLAAGRAGNNRYPALQRLHTRPPRGIVSSKFSQEVRSRPSLF
jgi:hypothetical protein